MELCEIITIDNEKQPESTQAIIACCGEETYAIPLSAVLTLEKVKLSDVSKVNQDDVIYLRDRVIPLVHLDRLFNIKSSENEDGTITVVVCMKGDEWFGLVVDRLHGQQDISRKSLGVLDDNEFFTGASILGDEVALILNVQSFVA